MKLFIQLLPLLLVSFGVLNYMFLFKSFGLTIILLICGLAAAIFNLIKNKNRTIAISSIFIVIGMLTLFTHLVNSGV
ncbi:hypothetical protein V7087_20540 [Neobacillus niacini]|uniref:hypothetical protein n=1 Tax=Neobacillus niacini TaxID=86668 RepID=UPI002FFD6014